MSATVGVVETGTVRPTDQEDTPPSFRGVSLSPRVCFRSGGLTAKEVWVPGPSLFSRKEVNCPIEGVIGRGKEYVDSWGGRSRPTLLSCRGRKEETTEEIDRSVSP